MTDDAHGRSHYNQINIYELILVCLSPCHVQMISETAYSSQCKLIGEGLLIDWHGIGYLNLAFEAKKGLKRPIFSFKPLKYLEGLEIHSQNINIKEFITKNPLKIGNFHLTFIADEGHKGQNLVFAS